MPPRNGNRSNTKSVDTPTDPASMTEAQFRTALFTRLQLLETQNTEALENQAEILQRLDTHETTIENLTSENKTLKLRVDSLEESFAVQDQYSRKDVVILTGVRQRDGETSTELCNQVISLLNRLTGLNLTDRDFSAIHRNRKSSNPARPPSITVKFLRLMDKDRLFTRTANAIRKNEFDHVKYHHALCPAFIEIKNKLEELADVKFVRYAGPGRFFTVCRKIKDESDKFYERIRSPDQYLANI